MKRKRLASLLLAGTLLAGCTGAPSSDTAQQSTQLDPAVLEDQSLQYFLDHPVNGGEPVTITMWVNEDWQDSYRYLVQEYQKYRPNVTIELVSFAWNTYWTKLHLAMENGTGPDVFHMHNGYLRDFQPYLAELPQEMFGEDVLSNSFSWVSSGEQGARHYVNLGCSTGGIFYNKQMWREAGLTDADIPRTWEQLRQLAIQLTQYDAAGNIKVDGFNFKGEAESLLFAMQAQKGKAVFDEAGQSHLSDPTSLESVEFLQGLYKEDRVCRMDQASAKELFGSGQAAMIYGWSWVANDLALNYPDIEYGFFRIPTWTEDTPPAYEYHNFETSFSINASSSPEVQQAAQDLLLFYLCNDQVLIRTARQAMIVPSKRSLLEQHAQELGTVINAQAEYIQRTAFKGVLPTAVYSYLTPIVNKDIWDPTLNSTELLHAADKEATKILQAYEFQSALPEYEFYNEFSE